jgi:putative DNA primase/helicase
MAPREVDQSPQNPRTGHNAKSDDAATWGTFEATLACCHARQMDGIGFVFSALDALAGIDLDTCRDPITGSLDSWALAIVADVHSYSEISPSGTGVKIFLRGQIPPGGNRTGGIEMYDHGRYFTVTGHHLPGTPPTIEERQEAIDTLHRHLFAKPSTTTAHHCLQPNVTTGVVSDDEVLARAMAARNGAHFARLWSGDTSEYPTHSEADLALCRLLAFWTHPDPERIDALFRRSGLYREKWERADYRERTIRLALTHGVASAPMGQRQWRGIRRISAKEVRSCPR